MSELEQLAQQLGNGTPYLPNKVIIDLFLRKLENSQTFSDEGSLPEEWRSINEYVL